METDWLKTQVNLGEIKERKTVTVEFQATIDLDVLKVTAGCGCSRPVYVKDSRKVLVNYTPNPIPMHLRAQGYYTPTQEIKVHYKSGGYDILKFSAKVVK